MTVKQRVVGTSANRAAVLLPSSDVTSTSAAEEEEEDVLDKAFDVRLESRLGCQARVVGEGEIVVEITRESLDAYFNEHPQVRDLRKG